MWVSTERSYRLIQTPFKSAKKYAERSEAKKNFLSKIVFLELNLGKNPKKVGKSRRDPKK